MARVAETQIPKQIRDVVVEVGFVDGTPIPFTSVDQVDFTWNESRGVAQGYSNARNKGFGIAYLDSKSADRCDVSVVECSVELYNRIKQAWENDERIDIYITQNNSKDRIVFNNAEIVQKPAQQTIGIGRETIQFHLVGDSFDVETSFE